MSVLQSADLSPVRDEATDFLLEHLADGPATVDGLFAMAAAERHQSEDFKARRKQTGYCKVQNWI